MTNIVVLNFSYDVPVKLFSTHLALIALLILYPNLKNLFHLFFLKKSVEFIPEKSLFQKKDKQLVSFILKIIAVSGLQIIVIVMIVKSFFDKPLDNHNLQAIYYPEDFIKNTENQWKKLIISNRYTTIFYDEKNYEYFDAEIDTEQQTIQLKSKTDTLVTHNLKYRFSNDNKTMYLSGTFKSDSISATFKVKYKEDFELVKRGFNWINEYPYNK